MGARSILGSSDVVTCDWLNMDDVNVNISVDIEPTTAQALTTRAVLITAIVGGTLLAFAWMPGGMAVIGRFAPAGRDPMPAVETDEAEPIELGPPERDEPAGPDVE